MSLKAFHIFFVTMSTLLFAGFAVWCFREASTTASGPMTAGGVACVLGAVGLVAYGIWFTRKMGQPAYE